MYYKNVNKQIIKDFYFNNTFEVYLKLCNVVLLILYDVISSKII